MKYLYAEWSGHRALVARHDDQSVLEAHSARVSDDYTSRGMTVKIVDAPEETDKGLVALLNDVMDPDKHIETGETPS